MKKKILAYRDIHQGEPICIIANGPSVLDVAWEWAGFAMPWRKPAVFTMGLNRAWQITRCDYYVMGDTGQMAAYIRQCGDLKRLTPLFTLDNGPDHAIRIHELQSSHRQISCDLTEGVYPNSTITAMGIQLALWMGCNPIYIAGLDCKGAHFWGGSDVPDTAWANQREAMGYIAGLLDAGALDLLDGTISERGIGTKRHIININHDSACRAFEFGDSYHDVSMRAIS